MGFRLLLLCKSHKAHLVLHGVKLVFLARAMNDCCKLFSCAPIMNGQLMCGFSSPFPIISALCIMLGTVFVCGPISSQLQSTGNRSRPCDAVEVLFSL